jgi:acetylornithine deacetylase/succinyl-diaminopimelate desuccinylase-like protein
VARGISRKRARAGRRYARIELVLVRAVTSLAVLGFASLVVAQQNPAAQTARAWRQAHEPAILGEYVELLAIPNLASDTPNIRKNADAVRQMLEKRGAKTRLLETPDAPPVVFGEIDTPGASRTIVFYAHYDGQPLDPKEWVTPPWQPVIRDQALDRDGQVVHLSPNTKIDPEFRIYARSASDDKAPILAITTALDALQAAHSPLKSNIKFVFEGEEEAGSTHLGAIIAANRDLLRSDVWLICDGPVHQSRRQQIVFGARGVETLDITVYGPHHELHSGHYGNWVPNPAMMLARLLASMKDDDGRVLVDHFYDGIQPLGETEKRAVAEAPDVDSELRREFWLGRTEGGGQSLVELLNLPSLNVRGMASARVGHQASNVIPSTATATIDMRLVKGIDHRKAAERLVAHIRKQGYFVIDSNPGPDTLMSHPKVAKVTSSEFGYNAARTSMDLPISQLVIRTADSVRGPVIKLPTMGGSTPLAMIEDILNVPTITVPIANHDNNQHSYNENVRVQNLWDGIELMAAMLAM